jgi:tetratricopeptide (TPR) repeat protein
LIKKFQAIEAFSHDELEGRKVGYIRSPDLPRSNMGNSDNWKRQGKYLFASSKYDESIKCLNRALTKDPEDVESWIYKGRSLYYLHKYADALKCYEKAQNLDPKNEDIWNDKLKACDKLLEASPKNAQVWDLKVEALISLDRCEDAAMVCDSDLGFELENAPKAWNCMGERLRSQGKHEEALSYYRKTLKQDPKDAKAWANMGKAMHLLGRDADSIQCFDKALETNREDAKVWAMKSAVLKALYRYPEADEADIASQRIQRRSRWICYSGMLHWQVLCSRRILRRQMPETT